MVSNFNPSLRTNHKLHSSKRVISIYCTCGYLMDYDSTTDVFGCKRCGLRCTPQSLPKLV